MAISDIHGTSPNVSGVSPRIGGSGAKCPDGHSDAQAAMHSSTMNGWRCLQYMGPAGLQLPRATTIKSGMYASFSPFVPRWHDYVERNIWSKRRIEVHRSGRFNDLYTVRPYCT